MKFESIVTEIRVYKRNDTGAVVMETLTREVTEEKFHSDVMEERVYERNNTGAVVKETLTRKVKEEQPDKE